MSRSSFDKELLVIDGLVVFWQESESKRRSFRKIRYISLHWIQCGVFSRWWNENSTINLLDCWIITKDCIEDWNLLRIDTENYFDDFLHSSSPPQRRFHVDKSTFDDCRKLVKVFQWCLHFPPSKSTFEVFGTELKVAAKVKIDWIVQFQRALSLIRKWRSI